MSSGNEIIGANLGHYSFLVTLMDVYRSGRRRQASRPDSHAKDETNQKVLWVISTDFEHIFFHQTVAGAS